LKNHRHYLRVKNWFLQKDSRFLVCLFILT
jgi:hypothetical protein